MPLWSLSKLVLSGDNCRVRDPKSGYEFNLSSLKGQDYPIRNDKYIYHLSVCGGLQRGICTHKDTGIVSSCQVDGVNQKIAGREETTKTSANIQIFNVVCIVSSFMFVFVGLANQVLSYVGDQLILNYTNGESCHKIYNRSTEIYFSCRPDRHPVSFTHTHRLKPADPADLTGL